MKLNRNDVLDILPLSQTQSNMLFEYLVNDEVYVERFQFKWPGKLDKEKFLHVIKNIAEKHPALKSVFRYKNVDKPIQIFLKQKKLPVFSLNEQEKMELDIEESPWKVYVADKEKNPEILLLYSHLLMDGWSLGIFINDMTDMYFEQNSQSTEHYEIEDIKSVLRRKSDDSAREAWRKYLDEYEYQNAVQGEKYLIKGGRKIENYKIPEALLHEMKCFTQEQKISMGELFYCMWGFLNQYMEDTKGICFGVTISGRNNHKNPNMIGDYIQVVPFRFYCEGTDKCVDVIQKMSLDFRMCATEEAILEEDLKDIARVKLFHSLVTIENYPLSLKDMNVDYTFTEENLFPLEVKVQLLGQLDAEIQIAYAEDAFHEEFETSKSILDRFLFMMKKILEDPKLCVNELEMMDEAEKKEFEKCFNQTNRARESQVFLEAFLKNAEMKPDRIAVKDPKGSLTYGQLLEKAERAAAFLKKQYGKKNPIVAIQMRRSIDVVAAMYAIQLSGAAYLPLHLGYSKEKVSYILNNSSAELLLVDKKEEKMTDTDVPVYSFGEIFSQDKAETPKEEITLPNKKDTAYVIYTSGSTGNPKGVKVSYKAISNRLYWIKEYIHADENDIFLFKTPYTFDVSVIELLLFGIAGARLIVLPQDEEKDPERIMNAIYENKVSVVHFVPSMMKAFTYYYQEMQQKKSMDTVRYVFSSGEALEVQHVRKAQKVFTQSRILNLYGPTEAAVDVTYYECTENEDGVIPIGMPIDNVKLYAVDVFRRQFPAGIPGELVISGDAVAEGYIGAELNSKKFIEIPWIEGRCFCTADQVVFDSQKGIYFLGRKDHQVKIRGNRVELGEIKQALLQVEGIEDAEAVVCSNKNEDPVIYAFVVKGDKEISEISIQKQIQSRLLEYSRPQRIAALDRFPVTAHGKTDTKKLISMAREFEEVRGSQLDNVSFTDTEEKIKKIWESELGISEVGLFDDFYTYGGSSIKLIYICSKLKKLFSCELTVSELLNRKTIQAQAQLIEQKKKENKIQKESPIIKRRESPVSQFRASRTQNDFYYMTMVNQSSAYNISGLYRLDKKVEKEKLQSAFQLLLERYDMLKTSYSLENGIVYGYVHNEAKIEIQEVCTTENELWRKGFFEEYCKGFLPDVFPLFRITLFSVSESKSYLLIEMNHILADGISLAYLMQDLSQLYDGKQLNPLGPDYIDECLYQEKYEEKVTMQDQLFWKNELKHAAKRLQLPYRKVAGREMEGQHFILSFEAERMKHIAEKYQTSQSVIFLAAYIAFLNRLTQQNEFTIGIVMSGRMREEQKNMAGPFVNTVPIWVSIKPHITLDEFISYIQKRITQVMEHQNVTSGELMEMASAQNGKRQDALYDVLYVYDSFEEGNLILEGMRAERCFYEKHTVKYDLTLFVYEKEQRAEFEYSSALFTEQDAQMHLRRLFFLMMQWEKNQKTEKLADCRWLFEKEAETLEASNHIRNTYKEQTIQQKFLDNAKRYKERPAIYEGLKKITYSQLEEMSGKVAAWLKQKGIRRNSIIAVKTRNGAKFAAIVLGILRTGAAYVPIEEGTPKDRVSYIVNDVKAALLVYETEKADCNCQLCSIESLWKESMEMETITSCEGTMDDIAYIIYTSGSTGFPKGCMLQQKSVMNYLNWASEFYVDQEEYGFPFFTSIAVDLTVTSLYVPLMSGNYMVVYENSIQGLKNAFTDQRCKIIKLTPTHLLFLSEMKLSNITIQKIIVGGEQLTTEVCRNIKEKVKNIRIYNEYGPTEATVGCMIYEYDPEKDKEGAVSIGTAIPNMEIYLLGENGKMALPGSYGEMYIGGTGVALGYTDQKQTKEKFLWNTEISDGKLYKTGDIARYDGNFTIWYLGRKDSQVKIAGHRIELDEVTRTVNEMKEIKHAAVLGKQDRLYTFAVQQEGSDIEESEVLRYLRTKLPDYMIPSEVIFLKELPYTKAGKIDNKALFTHCQERKKPAGTGNETIAGIVENVWRLVLGNEKPGRTESFFDVGGNSLKLLEVHRKLKKEFDFLEITDLFSHVTIEDMAQFIEEKQKNQKEESIYNQFPKEYLSGMERCMEKEKLSYDMESNIEEKLKKTAGEYHAGTFSVFSGIVCGILNHIMLSEESSFHIETENGVMDFKCNRKESIKMMIETMESKDITAGTEKEKDKISIRISSTGKEEADSDLAFLLKEDSKEVSLLFDKQYFNHPKIENIFNMVVHTLEKL